MELIWKDLEAERLFERRTVQVKVEGELPSPDGRSIAQIISSGGRVYLTSAAAEADEIRLEGRIDKGMVPKLDNAFGAMQKGASRVVIKHALDLLEDSGTVLQD